MGQEQRLQLHKPAEGVVVVEALEGGQAFVLSERLACARCGVSFPEVSPRMFSSTTRRAHREIDDQLARKISRNLGLPRPTERLPSSGRDRHERRVDDPVAALEPLALDPATRRRLLADNVRELLALT